MKTYVQEGDVCTFPAPGAIAAGAGLQVGNTFGVALSTLAAAGNVECVVEGVVTLPKAAGAGTGWTFGVPLYWDPVNNVVTKTAGALLKIGVALDLAGVADAAVVCTVRLNGAF